jgi:uncharacterized protein DUF1501
VSSAFTKRTSEVAIEGVEVYGQSDRIGAAPVSGRVFQTADLTATVFHCLGIDPHTELADQTGRPLAISTGKPMVELF